MRHYKKWTLTVFVSIVATLHSCRAIGITANGETPRTAFNAVQRSAAGQYVCMHDSLPQAEHVEETKGGAPEERFAPNSSAKSEEYKPIRIKLFSPDLDNRSRYCTSVDDMRPNFLGEALKCRAEDVFTETKRNALFSRLVPLAKLLHEERVKVIPVPRRIVVPQFPTNSICSRFSIPEAHQREGVADADLLLYIASSPERYHAAWAVPCSRGPDGRPLVGVVQVSTWFIEDTVETERALAHAMMHVLAFDKETFFSKAILGNRTNVRGKPTSVPVIQSPKVVAAAKVHFGCLSLSHLELEDAGLTGAVGSHWKARNMLQDLMSPMFGVGYYTTMTMALLEDLGYYRVNYEKAEVMSWGHHAGCKFFDEKCVQDGQTRFPSMFCTKNVDYLTCTNDRYQMGNCSILESTQPVPSHFQYFKSRTTYGSESILMDYCPLVLQNASVNIHCGVGPSFVLPGSLFGPHSRCLDITPTHLTSGNSSVFSGGVCAQVSCNNCNYGIVLAEGKNPTECTPGAILSLSELDPNFKGGTLTCPPFHEVCMDYANSSAAGGPYTPVCTAR